MCFSGSHFTKKGGAVGHSKINKPPSSMSWNKKLAHMKAETWCKMEECGAKKVELKLGSFG